MLELLLLSSAAVGVLLNTKHTGKFCKRKQAKGNVISRYLKVLQLMLHDGIHGFSLNWLILQDNGSVMIYFNIWSKQHSTSRSGKIQSSIL